MKGEGGVTCGGGLRELRGLGGLGELGCRNQLAILFSLRLQVCSHHTWDGLRIHGVKSLLDVEIPRCTTGLTVRGNMCVCGCGKVVREAGNQRQLKRDKMHRKEKGNMTEEEEKEEEKWKRKRQRDD